jgi:hypothetical protein
MIAERLKLPLNEVMCVPAAPDQELSSKGLAVDDWWELTFQDPDRVEEITIRVVHADDHFPRTIKNRQALWRLQEQLKDLMQICKGEVWVVEDGRPLTNDVLVHVWHEGEVLRYWDMFEREILQFRQESYQLDCPYGKPRISDVKHWAMDNYRVKFGALTIDVRYHKPFRIDAMLRERLVSTEEFEEIRMTYVWVQVEEEQYFILEGQRVMDALCNMSIQEREAQPGTLVRRGKALQMMGLLVTGEHLARQLITCERVMRGV